MATKNKERPNLKICIDNSEANSDEEASSSTDGDDIVIATHFEDDSSMDEDRDFPSDSEERARREAVVRVTSSSFKTKGRTRLLSSASPFKHSSIAPKSGDHKVKKESLHRNHRAKATTKPVPDPELKQLYESLGCLEEGKNTPNSENRLNAIHLRGIGCLSTTDILEYFKDYGPESVELIDSSSCNVLWSESWIAARAMLELSEVPEPQDKTKVESTKNRRAKKRSQSVESSSKEEKKKGSPVIADGEDDDDLNLMSEDEDDNVSAETAKSNDKKPEKLSEFKEEPTIPKEEPEEGEVADDDKEDSDESKSEDSGQSDHSPPGKWRIGKAGHKMRVVYMRFATKFDRAATSSETRSKGNRIEHRLGGTPGLTSSSNRKRKLDRAYMDYEEGEVANSSESGEEQIGEDAGFLISQSHQKSRCHIPDETIFDLHTRDAQSQRLKQVSVKDRLRQWSDDEQGSSDEDAIVDIDKLIAPPKPKRAMRMHADDEEEQVRAKRLKLQTAGILKRNARSSPPRDIRSRLQLGRRQNVDRYEDDYKERTVDSGQWDGRLFRQGRPTFRDLSSSDEWRHEPRDTGPPAREDLWRERREPFTLDPRAMEQKRNGIWNRNPDWDQDRYKDLDVPAEDDGIFSISTPVEEFGVIADDVQRRIKAEEMKSKKIAKEGDERKIDVASEKKRGDDEDHLDLSEEEEDFDEEDGKAFRPRKDWKLKSESKTEDNDLRSKLKSRDNDRW